MLSSFTFIVYMKNKVLNNQKEQGNDLVSIKKKRELRIRMYQVQNIQARESREHYLYV